MTNRWTDRQVDDASTVAFMPTVPLVVASFGLPRVDTLGLWWWLLVIVGLFGIAMAIGVVTKGLEASKRRWTLVFPVLLSIGVVVRILQTA